MNSYKSIIKQIIGMISMLIFCLLSIATVSTDESDKKYVSTAEGERPKAIISVDNVCAWPNLTVLHDGTIIATIHNQPSHLKQPADIECWASRDDGKTWHKRGTPAPRENPNYARGNVAAGCAGNGDIIVISSGWSDPAAKDGRGTTLPPMVSRSSDGGRTWNIDLNAFSDNARRPGVPGSYLVPFGDILPGANGNLHAGLYSGNTGSTFVYSSHDDGRTWDQPVKISEDAIIHEPALFHLGEGRWLVAARYDGLDLYASNDDARSWNYHSEVTGKSQHPGHIMRLNDSKLLLTYGNRLEPKGVDVRFSNDEGKTWSKPFRVVDLEGDCGYPSCVQIADGQVLTAYYARRVDNHDRYHMGVVTWDPSETFKP